MESNAPIYRGQWGGKISTGEEMWWSEPNLSLWGKGSWPRKKFALDPRHFFILRFWRQWRATYARPRTVLDFGCGTGGTTLNFSRVIDHPLTGVDLFPTQLRIAREFAEKLGQKNEFVQLTPEGRLPFADQSVDAIFSLDVLGHVPSIPDCLNEWSRVLKKNGAVLLFTEANYSPDDRSVMAKLAKRGADMVMAVPEHISLWPREQLEAEFKKHGLSIRGRYSANVGHFFFFPKDYVLLLKGRPHSRGIYGIAWVWNRISKILPFYPLPFHFMRIALTLMTGRRAAGTSYFYLLVKE